MYNVYISIIFSILCIHECVYMDRFLGNFLLNNDTYYSDVILPTVLFAVVAIWLYNAKVCFSTE